MKKRGVIPSIILKDPTIGPLAKKHGLPKHKRRTSPFQSLVHSIIYQQISGKAAESILKRCLALFDPTKGEFPSPQEVVTMPEERFREAGVSPQKITYLKDLARTFIEDDVSHATFSKMTNEEIITRLTKVKGIGLWTVQMFLIFTLRRPDVLPVGDLAIQKGFKIVYGMKKLPALRTMERLAKPWREHASLASLYLWKEADEQKKKK